MNILQKIAKEKREAVQGRKGRSYLQDIRSRISDAEATRPFQDALRQSDIRFPRLIAELKKASPSKGILRDDFDPPTIARIYENGGAAALSVLTEERYFLGQPAFLGSIRQKVALPLLQKDFIIDELQVYEGRAWGADAILLITALLETRQIKDYFDLASELSLAVLVEVHTEAELERVIEWAPVIGINNRDLHTFRTDLETTFRLVSSIPSDRTVVSESGIDQRAELEKLGAAGVHAVLVGEALMRSERIDEKLKSLIGV
ncbi:MAG: indole-3-glycerol phosphate synthase TrpC [Nitrospiria bacterium]